jgi:hypothetical protein
MSAALLIVVPTGPFSMLSIALVDGPTSDRAKWCGSPLIRLAGYATVGGADVFSSLRRRDGRGW